MTYQLTSEQYAANQVNQYMKKLGAPEHSGGANWIFSDSTSGGRVPAEVARAGGEVDGVRLPKEAYYVCAALWRAEPQVHILGHWTYPPGTKKNVYVASNAESVELFVNGQSLGHGTVTDKYLITFKDVAFTPGEIKAVATSGGRIAATHLLRTAGAPVALKLSTITAPGGLRADGEDIALIDVEAIDANGVRCPTVEQRADFETTGPAVWRGGYNSGKINSTNNLFLDLEAGLNRVAVRATRTAGKITVKVKSAGLRDASVTIESRAFAAEGGYSTVAPVAPPVKLSAVAPAHAIFASTAPAVKSPGKAATSLGKFIKTFNYTGPEAAIVHVEIGARDGRNIYIDRDYAFATLPAPLIGADWLQVADADQRYSAVDLIEMAVPAGTVVSIAHDDRAPLPGWLTKQFQPTEQTLAINGKSMKLFQRRVARDESLTFGSNTDGASVRANQYVVFVNAAAK
jgi:beta-galactosidase